MLIKKHTKNAHLLQTILTWKTYDPTLQETVNLNSTININEGIFLHHLVRICLQTIFINTVSSSFRCLEIGFAMGLSTMFILDACNTISSRKIEYHIFDPNQDSQWHYIGLYNAKKMATSNTHIQLTTETSDTSFSLLRKKKNSQKYHFIFIDGSHSYDDVLKDCINSHDFLHVKGLVVHDDVLHKGCRKAIQEYYGNNASYQRVILQINSDKKNSYSLIQDTNPLFKQTKDTYLHPSTMYAFQKLTD